MERRENKEFGKDRDEIFSKAVRAGKRTYFFDVKSTRKNDYYLTITESKKRFEDDGGHSYEKHKLFLYKEDFEKFIEGLQDVFKYIKNNLEEEISNDDATVHPANKGYADVEFDDLDK
jgi:hypothetical protein